MKGENEKRKTRQYPNPIPQWTPNGYTDTIYVCPIYLKYSGCGDSRKGGVVEEREREREGERERERERAKEQLSLQKDT